MNERGQHFLNADSQTLASLSYILKSFSSGIKSWQCLEEKAFFAQEGTRYNVSSLNTI